MAGDRNNDGPAVRLPSLDLSWDAATATAVLVLVALGYLILVRRGFRGFLN